MILRVNLVLIFAHLGDFFANGRKLAHVKVWTIDVVILNQLLISFHCIAYVHLYAVFYHIALLGNIICLWCHGKTSLDLILKSVFYHTFLTKLNVSQIYFETTWLIKIMIAMIMRIYWIFIKINMHLRACFTVLYFLLHHVLQLHFYCIALGSLSFPFYILHY